MLFVAGAVCSIGVVAGWEYKGALAALWTGAETLFCDLRDEYKSVRCAKAVIETARNTINNSDFFITVLF